MSAASDIEWRSISEFGARYIVSSEGHVRNIDTGRLLFGEIDRDGYRRVNLSRDGKTHKRRVHRLICEAFHGPSTDSQEVAHLDGDKSNNAAANLAWVTHRENNDHKRIHGTHQAGSRHPRARLSDEDVAAIRAASGSCSEIGARFGINRCHVSRIKTGARWHG